MGQTIKILGSKKFKSRVIKETSYGIVDDYGEKDNSMELMKVDNHLEIEWIIGKEEDVVHIGIETNGKDIVGYDGVFEIPKQSIELLKECGFNTKEIEDEMIEE